MWVPEEEQFKSNFPIGQRNGNQGRALVAQTTRIEITNVSKIYQTETKTVEAVKNFSESVKDGEFVCVVGASGCGKTTLLWCLSGLHPATSGTVHIDGELLTKPLPDRIGMVFQDSNLLPWRTLMENIELPFQIKKKPVNRELVDELLEVAGLKGFENSYPGELSGGMKQRGSIVRALAQDPDRNACRGPVAQGRCPRRTVRPDGHPRRPRGLGPA